MGIAPAQILRELAELWVTLGKPSEEDTSAGVLRACSMTLVVLAEEADDPMEIGETLAALMPEHPSRAIVIRVSASRGQGVSSRVFAQCWMPFAGRRQICCEQIEITASEDELAGVPALVLPLTVPDLPVVLWCRGARLTQLEGFPQLAALARKVVADSAAFAEPVRAQEWMLARVRSGNLAGDLAWTRLTRWRELIARIFENRAHLAELQRITRVEVACGPAAAAVEARYMAAWLSLSLRAAGASPALAFGHDETAPQELLRVELEAGETAFSVALLGETAEVRAGELVTRAAFPRATPYLLMREELSITGRDPIFEEALAEALSLAVSS